MKSVIGSILLTIAASPAFAQKAQVRVTRGPYYVGEPVRVQIQVTGFDETPNPECQPEQTPAGLRVQQAVVSPSVSTSIQIFNGRRYDSRTVRFDIDYVVQAQRAGQYTFGPFLITQDGKEVRADAVTLTFNDVADDSSFQVRQIIPSQPVFLGQRVPVAVELWLGEGLNLDTDTLNIYVPVFDRFSFADSPPVRSGLPVQTSKGTMVLPATKRSETVDGQTFTVFRAQRMLVPNEAGKFACEPTAASARKYVGGYRRRDPFDVFDGFFDSRSRQRTAPVRALSEPGLLVVKPLPQAGRPASFAGAVGPGYSMEVTADRTVVRVGDPITLHITVRGSGNLEHAGLPSLGADGGMDPQKFRLPRGEVPGVMQDGEKKFSASVRVTDLSVSEIPALAYSWFDPEDQSYHTTRSKPIALRVTEAQVVSAEDVVRHSPGPDNGNSARAGPPHDETAAGGPDRAPAPGSSSRGDSSLSGADLAIETSPGVVLSDASRRLGGAPLRISFYVAGLLMIAIALWDRKRRDIPPETVRRRRRLRELKLRVDGARGRPASEGAKEIADALRAMVAEVPDIPRDELQSVLAECETMIYAPGELGGGAVDSELVDRAAGIADQIVKESE